MGSFENKAMAEYVTKYPKTISFLDGLKGMINIENRSTVEQLQAHHRRWVLDLFQRRRQPGES